MRNNQIATGLDPGQDSAGDRVGENDAAEEAILLPGRLAVKDKTFCAQQPRFGGGFVRLPQAIRLAERSQAFLFSRRLCPSVTRNGTPILRWPDYNKLIFPKGLVSVASSSTGGVGSLTPKARRLQPRL
jgi:hypothetical protein